MVFDHGATEELGPMIARRRFRTFVLILGLLFSLASCGRVPTADTAAYTNFQYTVVPEGYTVQLSGTPYEIPVDNCDGARDSSKNEERSQKYIVELAISISDSIAGEFGGDIEIAKATIRSEISAALGIRIGSEVEAKSSVGIVTPPGKRSLTTVQWKETWTKGTVEIKKPNGAYVTVLPFAVLNSLTLEQLRSQTFNCEIDVQETSVPIQETAVPLEPTRVPEPPAPSEPTRAAEPPPIEPSPVVVLCPSAHLGAGKPVRVTMVAGCIYHFNVACNGCVAGQEDNYVVYYDGATVEVTVPEGSVWQFDQLPDPNWHVCQEEQDRWPRSLPSFLNISGVRQEFPCG